MVEHIVAANMYAKNFRLTEHKVIIWSKYDIMHGNLNNIRGNFNSDQGLYLTVSNF